MPTPSKSSALQYIPTSVDPRNYPCVLTLIAEVIAEAAMAEKPKIRYSAGKMANFSLAAQALLPDRLTDLLSKKQALEDGR